MGFLDFLWGKPTPDKFAKKVTAALRAKGVEGEIRYDPTMFSLTFGESMLNLSNLYAEFCATPRLQRRGLIERFISSVGEGAPEIPDSFESARKSLLPRVREPIYYAFLELRFRSDGTEMPKPLRLPLSPYHSVEVVYDTENAVISVTQEQLDKWGVTLDEALKVARDNLWRISNERFAEVAPGLHLSQWQDTHDSSRLYLHDLVWQLPVKGPHVVMTPSRDHLLVAGADDTAALAEMVMLAKKVLEEVPRPMHGRAVVLDGQRWVPFMPPQTSPIYQEFRFLDLMANATDYDEQKQLLDHLHEKEGIDILIANYSVLTKKDSGAHSSFSVWGEGVDTLLPLSELYALISDEGKTTHGLFAREKVEQAAGSLLEKTNHDPPRYRVTKFPTLKQIAAMGEGLGV